MQAHSVRASAWAKPAPMFYIRRRQRPTIEPREYGPHGCACEAPESGTRARKNGEHHMQRAQPELHVGRKTIETRRKHPKGGGGDKRRAASIMPCRSPPPSARTPNLVNIRRISFVRIAPKLASIGRTLGQRWPKLVNRRNMRQIGPNSAAGILSAECGPSSAKC